MSSAKLDELQRSLARARDEIVQYEKRAKVARDKVDALKGEQTVREHLATNADLDGALFQLEQARKAVDGIERRIAIEAVP